MRTVASYRFETAADDGRDPYQWAVSEVKEWLEEKGWNGTSDEFLGRQSSTIRVIQHQIEPPDGDLYRFAIIERVPESVFITEISIAAKGGSCVVFVELQLEGVGARLEPVRFEARRPKFISRLLSGRYEWRLGDNPLTGTVYPFVGSVGGNRAIDVIWHAERSVPVIMVSLIDGASVTSDFASKLAGDLAGLAIVSTLDENAAWAITKSKGAEWSCFNGAVRLYWPINNQSLQPRTHPFWLRDTILKSGTDPENASYRLRAQLRRQIMGVSAFAIREPRVIRDLVRSAAQKRQRELRAALESSSSSDEYRRIAESYASDNDKLREEVAEKDEKISALEDQVAELTLALRYVPSGESSIEPDCNIVVSSVADAVAAARKAFAENLIFGERVDEGVAGLNSQAGPPEKVYRYLSALNDLALARKQGPLGLGIVEWLDERGVVCSVESETVRRSGERSWPIGGMPVEFDFHLKPSDGVSPDRCVRIYFDFDPAGNARIGWLGRHPGT